MNNIEMGLAENLMLYRATSVMLASNRIDESHFDQIAGMYGVDKDQLANLVHDIQDQEGVK